MSDTKDYFKEAFIVIIIFGALILNTHLKYAYTKFPKTPIEPFSEPVQEMIDDSSTEFTINDDNKIVKIIPVAKYKVYARVLAIQHQKSMDVYNKIVPFDIALGWRGMATRKAAKHIKILQSQRQSSWMAFAGPPLNCQEIQSMYSNNHVIPANKNIYKSLKKVRKKDAIYLEGFLVNVQSGKNGKEQMLTSLSRTDAGCEVIYVTRVVTKNGEFK